MYRINVQIDLKRIENRPEKIGISLDPLGFIPDKSAAVRKIVSVPELNESVVLNESLRPGEEGQSEKR